MSVCVGVVYIYRRQVSEQVRRVLQQQASTFLLHHLLLGVTLLPLCIQHGTLTLLHATTAPTQPCIPPGSLHRPPASAGVKAGMSPLPGGR